jgi:hypothetical protein
MRSKIFKSLRQTEANPINGCDFIISIFLSVVATVVICPGAKKIATPLLISFLVVEVYILLKLSTDIDKIIARCLLYVLHWPDLLQNFRKSNCGPPVNPLPYAQAFEVVFSFKFLF